MWDKTLQYLNDNKDALGWLFGSGVVLAVLGGVYRFIVWSLKEYRLRKTRSNENFPFKIIPPNSNVAKEILGGSDDDPLADRNIPYQQRIQGKNTRRELEELIEDNRWLLITGRTGLGKTREAVQLAQSLSNEGWTILCLTRDTWLDAPAKLPSNVPERKVLFFLDDLNKKCHSSKAEIRPNIGESLTLSMSEPFQMRLQRTLEAFDTFCGKSEIRVIATARNENSSEFDEPSEWEKLGWTKYNDLWKKFMTIDLPEPDKYTEETLLAETAKKVDIHIISEELPMLAKRNDGTFRNLVENLSYARTEGFSLSAENFRDTLKGTWQKRYQKAVKKFPEAIEIYDAIELLTGLGIRINFWNIIRVSEIIAERNNFQKIVHRWKSIFILKQLIATENLLNPRDGQIEAKGYKIKLERYLAKLYFEVGKEYVSTRSIYMKIMVFYGNYLLTPKGYFINEQLSTIQRIFGPIILVGAFLHNLGIAYNSLGFSSHALVLFRRSLELKKWDYIGTLINRNYMAGSWVGLGYSHYKINQFDEAINSFQKAIELDHKNQLFWEALGESYRQIEQYDKAIESYQTAIDLKPKSSTTWNGLGNIYYDFGKYEEAVSAYNKAIELDASETVYLGNLGILFLTNNNIEDAIKVFNKSIEIDPEYVYSILSLALCCKKNGDIPKSEKLISDIEPIIAKEEEYIQACFSIAKGDLESGLQHLKNGLERKTTSKAWARKDPNFEDVREYPRFQEIVGLK